MFLKSSLHNSLELLSFMLKSLLFLIIKTLIIHKCYKIFTLSVLNLQRNNFSIAERLFLKQIISMVIILINK
jgi:hypothetical protein